jgi:hypothetical protein
MKQGMSLLDANMALLKEANIPAPSNPIPTDTLAYSKAENGSPSGASGHTDDYSFSNPHLSASGGFNSPSQYSFDTPYYSTQRSAEASPATYQPLPGGHSQEFAFGGGNPDPWSY